MKASEISFLDFLKGPQQFLIPIYQRSYSWTRRQCEQLWRDVVRACDDNVAGHFIGSIVYIQKGLYVAGGIPRLLVIDGQQRLTTLTLLLDAYGDALKAAGLESGEVTHRRLQNYFLFNTEEDGDLRYKLLLTDTDRRTLVALLEDRDLPSPASERIAENHAWLSEQMKTVDLARLYRGIAKLLVVGIALDRANDNPQLIFESLNSTGLALSQADLIRNYVLMGLEPAEQERLYTQVWRPMEERFGAEAYADLFDAFARDYLTVKTGQIPNVDQVYQAFKDFSHSGANGSIHDLVAELARYAGHYTSLRFPDAADSVLASRLDAINTLRVDVAYPFLLEVLEDLRGKRLSRDEFLEILTLVESYVFRRFVCGIPTNSLNKTFATLAREIDKARYLESFKAAMALKDSYKRFPTDEEFRRELVAKDMYNIRSRAYWLGRLENHDRKERVNVEEYTIEHVLPQNENLSPAWRTALGERWQEIQARYLHTIGNLTLTGYNSSLSDRSFQEKRAMPGGFADSPIRLNRDLAHATAWTEAEITARADALATLAIQVWPYPSLPSEVLDTYRPREPKPVNGRTYSIEDHPYLLGPLRPLFEEFRKRTLNLDPSVTEKFLSLYVAYKTNTNFVDLVPQKSRLRLTLNVRFGELYDPKSLCHDVTGLGRWGNGDVEVYLESATQLDSVMALVRQSFAKSLEE